jgi:hypothetical protein
MRTFKEFIAEQEKLDENAIVNALGHLWMGLVGTVAGTVTGAVGGAIKGGAKAGWRGLTTGDPFNIGSDEEAREFQSVMNKFQGMLAQADPEYKAQVKQHFCQIVQGM